VPALSATTSRPCPLPAGRAVVRRASRDLAGPPRAHGRWPDLVEATQFRMTRVVLAAAHLDSDPTNNRLTNLRALCQRCHLLHDRSHLAQRWITYRRRLAIGVLFLGPYQALIATVIETSSREFGKRINAESRLFNTLSCSGVTGQNSGQNSSGELSGAADEVGKIGHREVARRSEANAVIIPERDAEFCAGVHQAEESISAIAPGVTVRAAADLALDDVTANVALGTIGVQRDLWPVEHGQLSRCQKCG
jgi:hypothetical protein